MTKTYNTTNLFDDIKALYKIAGFKGLSVCFIFTDAEVKDEGFLEYINQARGVFVVLVRCLCVGGEYINEARGFLWSWFVFVCGSTSTRRVALEAAMMWSTATLGFRACFEAWRAHTQGHACTHIHTHACTHSHAQILMTGEVAGLLPKDELDMIVNDIRPIMKQQVGRIVMIVNGPS